VSYGDARLKIQRSQKHIADLHAAILALEETYTSTVEYRMDGGESLIHEVPNFRLALNNLSLIVGDAVHNARSAMDFAWHNTISRCLPDRLSEYTKFPVRDTRNNIEGALRDIEIDKRCPALFDCVISKIQPYNGGDTDAVWTLHDLDISDKHLVLLGLEPIGHITGITVRDTNGELHRGSSLPAIGGDGRYVVDLECGFKVENKGKLSVHVTVQEAGDFSGVTVESLLSGFTNFALYTINLLENVSC